MEKGGISLRKLDHLILTSFYPVEHRVTTLLEEVMLIPRSIPELDLDKIDASVWLLGKRLQAPIIVSGMTGGHPLAGEVNAAIAAVVEELGLGMGVGSQRAALHHPELVETYRIVRKHAPTALVIGNIGAAQLRELSLDDVEKLVEMIEADALAVHVNVPQELFQPEGDERFEGVLEAIERIVERVNVPIIVKETGHSIDPWSVAQLAARGVECVDVSGAGGTSWVRVEELRARNMGEELLAEEASTYRDWGLPTALAVVAARWAAPTICIIAGGGIRTGLDALRAVAIGADAASIALPVLRAFVERGVEGVRRYLTRVVEEFKKGMMLIGARTVDEVYKAGYILGPRLAALASSLVPLHLYESARRARLYTRSRVAGTWRKPGHELERPA